MKKKDEAADTGKKKAEEKPKMLGSKEVASQLGVKPATLRRWLRSKGKGTQEDQGRYEWAPESKELNQLKKDFQAWQQEQTAEKKNKDKDKGKGKKGSKGSSKKKEEEDGEEDGEELN